MLNLLYASTTREKGDGKKKEDRKRSLSQRARVRVRAMDTKGQHVVSVELMLNKQWIQPVPKLPAPPIV
jgi:hypothetical protein